MVNSQLSEHLQLLLKGSIAVGGVEGEICPQINSNAGTPQSRHILLSMARPG